MAQLGNATHLCHHLMQMPLPDLQATSSLVMPSFSGVPPASGWCGSAGGASSTQGDVPGFRSDPGTSPAWQADVMALLCSAAWCCKYLMASQPENIRFVFFHWRAVQEPLALHVSPEEMALSSLPRAEMGLAITPL